VIARCSSSPPGGLGRGPAVVSRALEVDDVKVELAALAAADLLVERDEALAVFGRNQVVSALAYCIGTPLGGNHAQASLVHVEQQAVAIYDLHALGFGFDDRLEERALLRQRGRGRVKHRCITANCDDLVVTDPRELPTDARFSVVSMAIERVCWGGFVEPREDALELVVTRFVEQVEQRRCRCRAKKSVRSLVRANDAACRVELTHRVCGVLE
jgi:hypothetical protein